MPDIGEFVDAYDTRSGEKVTVPANFPDLFTNLSRTPPKASSRPESKPVPAKTASKADWVAYATKDAPQDKRLSKENAESLSVEALHDYYTQGG